MPIIKYHTEEEKRNAMMISIKKYKNANKNKINETARDKIKCKVCNCYIARSSKSRHEKLKKHISNIV